MKRSVKVAMIGLGWWGRKMTAVLRQAKDEIEILCAAEPDPAGKEFAAANTLCMPSRSNVPLPPASTSSVKSRWL